MPTYFAQLSPGTPMTKSAMLGKLHKLVQGGIWKHVADRTPATSGMGRVARWFHNPITNKSTKLNHGLTAYGLGGMVTGMAGYDLPGSSLAMNASMPILGALFTAPSIIQSVRAGRPGNQAKMKEDMLVGARGAGADMMSLGQMDHRFLTQPGLAQQYIQQNDPDTANLVTQYANGRHKPMSRFHRMQSLFENPDALINDEVDSRIHGMLAPSGMLKAGGAISTGFSHAFPWLFPTMAVGMLGHSILRDKPYDEIGVRSRGYAGAQAKIQKELGGLSGMERFALRMDPSLIASRLEKAMPGTIGTWEQKNQQKFQPGLLGSIAGSWNKGGETNYYQYDAAGNRKYV